MTTFSAPIGDVVAIVAAERLRTRRVEAGVEQLVERLIRE